MTIQAIQHRLVHAVDEIELVHTDADFGAMPAGPGTYEESPTPRSEVPDWIESPGERARGGDL